MTASTLATWAIVLAVLAVGTTVVDVWTKARGRDRRIHRRDHRRS